MKKVVLDCCCSSRAFWFDKQNELALFTDIREEEWELCDGRKFVVKPDRIEDVTHLSFPDKSFKLVVFDPPHLRWVGENSWMHHKYGRLPEDWRRFLYDAVHECMRVLDDYGVLIFKWNEKDLKVSTILKAIKDFKPLFGHVTRRNHATIWMCFMKIPESK